MTRDEIFDLEAGSKMDALVAIKIMGLPDISREGNPCAYCGSGMWHGGQRSRCSNCNEWRYSAYKNYSGEISSAWEVVENLRDRWTQATEGVHGLNNDFPRPFDDQDFFEHLHRFADRRWPWAMLYITPVEICRAALLAFSDTEDGG